MEEMDFGVCPSPCLLMDPPFEILRLVLGYDKAAFYPHSYLVREPPSFDFLKFNVYGSSRGKLDLRVSVAFLGIVRLPQN